MKYVSPIELCMYVYMYVLLKLNKNLENPKIKTLFSVEGGGDSGKDDTSDKDMEEEEECKSSLL